MTAAWTTDRVPNLTGTTVIVTGANGGIGLESARVFAVKGADVVFAVRYEKKGGEAAATVSGSTEVRRSTSPTWGQCVSSPRTGAAASGCSSTTRACSCRRSDTRRTGSSCSSASIISGTSLSPICCSPHITGRVVTVASSAHRSGTIDFDDLNWQTRRYGGGSGAYAQWKLANLLFPLELQRRLEASRSSVIATAAHPGVAATNLMSSSKNPVMSLIAKVALALVAQDAGSGATATPIAATESAHGGSYAGPGKLP